MIGKMLKELGYTVISLDNRRSTKPTILVDIMEWNYQEWPQKSFEVISAGGPCTEYSCAKTVGAGDLDFADAIVQKTLEIIQYFHPKY